MKCSHSKRARPGAAFFPLLIPGLAPLLAHPSPSPLKAPTRHLPGAQPSTSFPALTCTPTRVRRRRVTVLDKTETVVDTQFASAFLIQQYLAPVPPPTRGLGLITASEGGTTPPRSPTRHSHSHSHADGHARYPRASAPENGTRGKARGQALRGFPSTGRISRRGPARRQVWLVMSPTCCFPNRLHDSQFERQRWTFYHFHEVTLSPAHSHR